LFSLQKEQQAQQASGVKKVDAGSLRVQKDLSELKKEGKALPQNIKLDFPDPDNIMKFVCIIKPEDGPYRGGVFRFTFNMPPDYPHTAPKVLCDTNVSARSPGLPCPAHTRQIPARPPAGPGGDLM